MKNMKDKVVLVTGGASGIGLATAKRFASAGCRVAIGDLNGKAAIAAAREITAAGGIAVGYSLDTRSESSWKKVLTQLQKKLGPLHVVVNNAGTGSAVPLAQTTLALWRKVNAVNTEGVFLGTKLGIEAIEKAGGGAIVNISSIRGVTGYAGSSAYCASKAAVRLLSKVAALECAQAKNNVRVNCVLPGYVETPLVARNLTPARRKPLTQATPMGRFAQPAEIADAIFYLASPQASYITGTDLLVDGGYTAI